MLSKQYSYRREGLKKAIWLSAFIKGTNDEIFLVHKSQTIHAVLKTAKKRRRGNHHFVEAEFSLRKHF